MNIVRIWLNPQYQCTTEKSLSEQSVTIGAKNVSISHGLKGLGGFQNFLKSIFFAYLIIQYV